MSDDTDSCKFLLLYAEKLLLWPCPERFWDGFGMGSGLLCAWNWTVWVQKGPYGLKFRNQSFVVALTAVGFRIIGAIWV